MAKVNILKLIISQSNRIDGYENRLKNTIFNLPISLEDRNLFGSPEYLSPLIQDLFEIYKIRKHPGMLKGFFFEIQEDGRRKAEYIR